jgi:hypothetical protein
MKKIATLFGAGAIALVLSYAYTPVAPGGHDFSFLKGQKELNVEYDYSNLKVGKKDMMDEPEYIKKKTDEGNKKEAGKGDHWAELWTGGRKNHYEPKFEDLCNKQLTGLVVGAGKTGAKYTLILHTVMIEPGFNVGVMKQPAFCNYEISIVETADHSKVKLKWNLGDVMGSNMSGMDFDPAARIVECFAKGGKMIGKDISKSID